MLIIDFLADTKADVFILQEVDINAHRTHRLNIAREIARKLRLNYVFGREFVELTFSYLDLDWRQFVAIDPRYFRPAEVDHLHANPAKARVLLGWKPEVSFAALVVMMIESDLAELNRTLKGGPEAMRASVSVGD